MTECTLSETETVVSGGDGRGVQLGAAWAVPRQGGGVHAATASRQGEHAVTRAAVTRAAVTDAAVKHASVKHAAVKHASVTRALVKRVAKTRAAVTHIS